MLITKKFFGGSNGAIVTKNSTSVFSSTEDDFGGVRPNSYIKFDGSDLFYSVLSAKKIIFSKPFISMGNRKIKFNSEIGLKIQVDDIIRLSYDNYELDYVFGIQNGGKHYAENDVLTVRGGEVNIAVSDGMGEPTKLSVSKLERDGGIILGVEVLNRGKYIVIPEEEVLCYGGIGSDAKFKLKYRKLESQELEEKMVKGVEVSNNETILTLDYSLCPGIKSGNVSFEKWEILLSAPYSNDSSRGAKYKLFSEFTPNYSLPLTIKNNSDFDLVFNDSMSKIDMTLKSMETKIQELEKELLLLKG